MNKVVPMPACTVTGIDSRCAAASNEKITIWKIAYLNAAAAILAKS